MIATMGSTDKNFLKAIFKQVLYNSGKIPENAEQLTAEAML